MEPAPVGATIPESAGTDGAGVATQAILNAWAASRPMPRELWVWHLRDARALVALAERHAVTRLLVWVSPGFTADPARLSRLSDLGLRARLVGIEVDALCGDPSWATNPQEATRWALEVRKSGLFMRLHLDIEPHARPDWATGRSVLAKGLLTALRGAASSGMPVDADIPYWYDTVPAPDGGPLDVAVMRVTSSVTIMAYRDHAAAVLAAAAPALAHAQGVGKPAWVGMNLASSGGDPASSSYLGQPRSVIQRDISALDTAGRRWPSFAGLALHDSDSLAAL